VIQPEEAAMLKKHQLKTLSDAAVVVDAIEA
jgi:hypothetical protein